VFNIGPAEMAVLAIIAVVVFGPDRLPALAKQAAQLLRTVRDMSTNARKQLSDLSPGLDESLKDLDLDLGALAKGRNLNARTALQKMIFEDAPTGPTAGRTPQQPPSAPPADPGPVAQAPHPEPSPAQPAVSMDKAERAASAASADDDIT
jgi:sec-independent protein translocase protein TatB